MEQKKPTGLTDEELLQEAKKIKSVSITNAILIGFLIGIIIYSVMKNSLGFLTLIPLFLSYKLINSSKYNNKKTDNLLRKRNLK